MAEKIKETSYCAICEQNKDIRNFYKTNIEKYNNEIYKSKTPYCINCIKKMVYPKGRFEKNAFLKILKEVLNLRYDEDTYIAALTSGKRNILSEYIRKMNLIKKDIGDITWQEEDEQVSKETTKKEKIINNEETYETLDDDFEVTKEIIRYWGKGFTTDEYSSLDSEYQDWCRRYDVSSKAMEVNVKEICYQQLEIKIKRENHEPVDKELKSLSDLMGNSALKPIQESAAASAEFNTLGTWIKTFENEEPIPKADEELQDVDGFKKYIRVWFLGHMCKILGVENEYSEEYDEETLQYSIDIHDDDEGEVADVKKDDEV
jgi:hypothetical protein